MHMILTNILLGCLLFVEFFNMVANMDNGFKLDNIDRHTWKTYLNTMKYDD